MIDYYQRISKTAGGKATFKPKLWSPVLGTAINGYRE
jgi:hypothetical protein